MFVKTLVHVLWCMCINIIFNILKDPTIFHKVCLIEITYYDNINTTNEFVLKCVLWTLTYYLKH